MSKSALRDYAVEVVRRLRESGFEALWAGGCVRDQLLELDPQDYDVATSAKPEEIRQVFGYRRTIPVGAAFGVVTVLEPRQRFLIEIATFRRDGRYSDGRHPDVVEYSDAKNDAARRDFTINGMFFDPIDNRVIDYVGGQEDLKNRLVRCIGAPNERLSEDKLRMLRAVRFAAHFGFRIADETMEAIQALAREILVVSRERICNEMRRILVNERRVPGLELLQRSNLVHHVLPEYGPPHDFLGEEWGLAKKLCLLTNSKELEVLLACLIYPFRKAEIQQRVDSLANRWRLSNREQLLTAAILQNQMAIRAAGPGTWPEVQRLLIKDSINAVLEFAEAVEQLEGNSGSGIRYCREKLALPCYELNPKPLVTGKDLINLGIPRGKHYSLLLDRIRDAQLNEEIINTEEGLQLAHQIWSELVMRTDANAQQE